MKVIFGSDTKDFDRGAKTVKQGLNDLDKVGGDALSSLGDAFGVNTGKIGQMTSAVTGLGQKLSQSGNEGVKAFGAILKSIGPVGSAIAGIGFASAIAGFKSLQAEADAFKQTVEGANIEMATAAYVDTYRQVLRDFRGDTGRALAESESSWKKFWGTLGASFKAFVSSGAMGEAGAGVYGRGTETFITQLDAANDKGRRAEEITNRIYELERKRKEQAVELAKINGDISDQMLIARDASAGTTQRQAAIAAIEADLAKKKTMTVTLEKELAQLYSERSSLASDSVEAADATLAQEARAYDAERAINVEAASLLEIKNSIGRVSAAEAAQQREITAQLKEQEAALAAIHARGQAYGEAMAGGLATVATPGVTTPSLALRPKQEDIEYFKQTFTANLGQITVGIGFKANAEEIKDITNEVTSLVGSAATRSAELIGDLIGTLASGGDAWGDFKNAALSSFGDMAIAIGKIAINAGLAVSGIQAAINSGNWYIAVAAGAALVALGAAVKSSLSSVASGDYSAAGGGYSGGGYSSGASGFETREISVNVNGTLQADGNQLLAVIKNVNKKNYYLE